MGSEDQNSDPCEELKRARERCCEHPRTTQAGVTQGESGRPWLPARVSTRRETGQNVPFGSTGGRCFEHKLSIS